MGRRGSTRYPGAFALTGGSSGGTVPDGDGDDAVVAVAPDDAGPPGSPHPERPMTAMAAMATLDALAMLSATRMTIPLGERV